MNKPASAPPADSHPNWRIGERVEWQDSFGNWREATITAARICGQTRGGVEYDAALDSGEDADGYSRYRFRSLATDSRAAAEPLFLPQHKAEGIRNMEAMMAAIAEPATVAQDIERFDEATDCGIQPNTNGCFVRYADHARIVAELQAARDAAADFDCDDRRDDADFWWNVAAFRAVEIGRQIAQNAATEASLAACRAEHDALLARVANAPVGTVLAVTAGDDIGDLETTVLSGQSHKNGTRIAMVALPLAGEVAK